MSKFFQGEIVLVIGVSCGIGVVIVDVLVVQGVIVIGIVIIDVGVVVIGECLVVVGGYGCVLNVIDVVVLDVVLDGIVKEFGVIIILVNNVGIICDNLLLCMKDEDWQVIFDINFISVFCIFKVVICGMMKVCKGCIINIVLVIGVIGNVGQVNYVVVKVGIIVFFKLLVKEIGLCGIIVNVVVLGFIDIDMIKVLLEEQCIGLVKLIVLECFGELFDIVNVVVFLVGFLVSYIIGEIFYVNGGMYML